MLAAVSELKLDISASTSSNLLETRSRLSKFISSMSVSKSAVSTFSASIALPSAMVVSKLESKSVVCNFVVCSETKSV